MGTRDVRDIGDRARPGEPRPQREGPAAVVAGDGQSRPAGPGGTVCSTTPPASTGNSDDFPITPFEAKRELLDACGGNADRAREIWDERNFGRAAGHGMNRAELDGLLAKVDA